MSRSVTKLALGVSVPLATLATLAVLGSHQAATPTAARSSAIPSHMTRFGVRNAGPNALSRLDLDTPLPTAAPTPSPAPVVAQAPSSQPALAPRSVAPLAPRPPAPRPPSPPVTGVGGAAGVEFSLVNQDRAGNGVAALAWSSALARVAQYRAQDMLNRNYFSHYDPSTGQLAFVQLMHLWGIPYSTAGENIAWSTNPSMANINVMFMNSPEHRANILNGAYHRVGVGVASNGSKVMVVEVFSN